MTFPPYVPTIWWSPTVGQIEQVSDTPLGRHKYLIRTVTPRRTRPTHLDFIPELPADAVQLVPERTADSERLAVLRCPACGTGELWSTDDGMTCTTPDAGGAIGCGATWGPTGRWERWVDAAGRLATGPREAL